jgi:hypothetical protein
LIHTIPYAKVGYDVRGLPKSIIDKYGISKRAWEIYRGRKTSPKPHRRRLSLSRHRRAPRRRRMYAYARPRRHYGFRRHHASKAIPLLPTITGVIPAIVAFDNSGGVGGIISNPTMFAKQLLYEYTGWDTISTTSGGFNPPILIRNLSMWGAGMLGHWMLNRLGVNRSIKKVPMIGKYITL